MTRVFRRLLTFFSEGSHLLFCLFLVCAIAVSCGDNSVSEADFTILYVTDVHGRLLPSELDTLHPHAMSMAHFSSYVKQVRDDCGSEQTILLCGGNLNEGQPAMYAYNTSAIGPKHISPLVLNYMGFDAVALGARDLSIPRSVWRDTLSSQFKMPFLCGNLKDETSDEDIFPAYTILRRQGMKVAVVSLVDPNDCRYLSPDESRGLKFDDLTQSARKWVKQIIKTEAPDYVIAMLAAGSRNQSILSVQGIDLYLLGSDHRSLTDNDFRLNEKHDSVLFAEPLPRLRECIRVDLHLEKRGKRVISRKAESHRIPLDKCPIDDEYVSVFSRCEQDVAQYLNRPVGTLSASIPYNDAIFGPSALLNLMHDVQLWATGADVSITNNCAGRGNFNAGAFSMRDVLRLYRRNGRLWVVKMTGDEICRFLEAAVGVQYNKMSSPNDHLLAFRLNEIHEVQIGRNGPELIQPVSDYCSVAGLCYTVDVTRPVGSRVEIHGRSDGGVFCPKDTFCVAMSDYLACGGGGYVRSLKWNRAVAMQRIVRSDTLDMRSLFLNFIQANSAYSPNVQRNWSVVPVKYYENGKMRDTRLFKIH